MQRPVVLESVVTFTPSGSTGLRVSTSLWTKVHNCPPCRTYHQVQKRGDTGSWAVPHTLRQDIYLSDTDLKPHVHQKKALKKTSQSAEEDINFVKSISFRGFQLQQIPAGTQPSRHKNIKNNNAFKRSTPPPNSA